MKKLKAGNEFDFSTDFAPTDGEAGINIYYLEGEAASVLDGRNLFSVLYSGDIHPELADEPEVLKCYELVAEGKTPSFVELYSAQAAESVVRNDVAEPTLEGGFWYNLTGWRIFATEVPAPVDHELETRGAALRALRHVYDQNQESTYAIYCEAVNAAEAVCERLGVEAHNFPTFAEFLDLSSAERDVVVDKYKAADDVVERTYDDYVKNNEFISEFFDGNSRTEEHKAAYVRMLIEPNPKEALEAATEYAVARAELIEAHIENKRMFGKSPEINKEHLFSSNLPNLGSEADDVKNRTSLLRKLHSQIIRSDINAIPEERRNALHTFENASADTLEATIEHYQGLAAAKAR